VPRGPRRNTQVGAAADVALLLDHVSSPGGVSGRGALGGTVGPAVVGSGSAVAVGTLASHGGLHSHVTCSNKPTSGCCGGGDCKMCRSIVPGKLVNTGVFSFFLTH